MLNPFHKPFYAVKKKLSICKGSQETGNGDTRHGLTTVTFNFFFFFIFFHFFIFSVFFFSLHCKSCLATQKHACPPHSCQKTCKANLILQFQKAGKWPTLGQFYSCNLDVKPKIVAISRVRKEFYLAVLAPLQ